MGDGVGVGVGDGIGVGDGVGKGVGEGVAAAVAATVGPPSDGPRPREGITSSPRQETVAARIRGTRHRGPLGWPVTRSYRDRDKRNTSVEG